MKKTLKTTLKTFPKDLLYLHDNQCFHCQKETGTEGALVYCDFCTRAYHTNCVSMQLNQNQQSICPCCQQNRNCQFCQLSPQANDKILLCTLCYLPVHHSCYMLVKGKIQPILTEEEMEGVIFGNQAYVCRKCLLRNGIIKIKAVKRFRTIKNFEIEQKIVSLVHVKSKSPVHYGWFAQAIVQKAFSQQKQALNYSKKYKQIRNFHPRLLNRRPIIQKILAIRPQKQQQVEVKYLQVVSNIRDGQRSSALRLGGANNYKFLVKWQNCQYELASWQDEYTIKILDPGNFYIQKFLYQFLNGQSIGKYDYIQTHLKQRLLTEDPQVSGHILKMAKFRWKYPIQIVINQKGSDIMLPICKYLNQIYILQKQRLPSVILVHQAKLALWQNALISKSRYINMVCFRGSAKSCNLIRSIEFSQRKGRPSFDVLLLSYQMYKNERERDYILYYVNHAAVYLCIDFENPSFITNFYHRGIADHFIYIVNRVINNPSVEGELVKNICSYFQRNLIIKHTINWTELDIMTTKRHVEDGKTVSIQVRQGQSEIAKTVKKEPFPQLKRLSFLAHILQFGIDLSLLNQLHEKMLESCCELYDITSEQSKQHLKSYIRGFFSILTHYNEVIIPLDIVQYYIFDLNPIEVMKRVMQLSKLREVLKLKDYQFDICIMEDEKADQRALSFKNWNNCDDLILANLIIEVGFGNWQKIAQNIEWKKHSKTQELSKIAFELYVKVKAFASGLKNISVIDFIADRSELILQRMSTGI